MQQTKKNQEIKSAYARGQNGKHLIAVLNLTQIELIMCMNNNISKTVTIMELKSSYYWTHQYERKRKK